MSHRWEDVTRRRFLLFDLDLDDDLSRGFEVCSSPLVIDQAVSVPPSVVWSHDEPTVGFIRICVCVFVTTMISADKMCVCVCVKTMLSAGEILRTTISEMLPNLIERKVIQRDVC